MTFYISNIFYLSYLKNVSNYNYIIKNINYKYIISTHTVPFCMSSVKRSVKIQPTHVRPKHLANSLTISCLSSGNNLT